MNKVLLMGRLAKEPELRQTRSGKSTASWVLAVDKPYKKDRPEGEPTADFIPLVSWDKSADFVGQYLHKGSRVMVEGRMQVRSYEAQDGSRRYVTEVVTQNIEFADSKPKDGGYGQQQGGFAQAYNGFGQPTNQGVPY